MTLEMLVAVLLTWISANSNYPMPDHLPTVKFAPATVIQQAACGEPCSAIGYDDGNGTVFIDDRLRTLETACERSVLLHELVHTDQDLVRRWNNAPPPIQQDYREHEAYAMEKKWLAQNGVDMTVPEEYVLGAFTDPGSCGKGAR